MIDIYGKVETYYRDCCGDYCKGYCKNYHGGSYGGYWWVRILFIDLAYCTSYLGTVGVKEDILVLKLNGVKNL